MKPGDAQRGLVHRAPWLRLARRQSQALAEARAGLQVPLRWEAAPMKERDRSPRRGLHRFGAMLLLPALILGCVTGTWAFVRHLQRQASTPLPRTAAPVLQQQQPEAPRVLRAPAPAPRRRAAPAAQVTPKPHPRRLSRKLARAEKAAPPPSQLPAPTTGPVIVIPTRIVGDDQVIIVSPPAKLKPLWSVEAYKKARGGAGRPAR